MCSDTSEISSTSNGWISDNTTSTSEVYTTDYFFKMWEKLSEQAYPPHYFTLAKPEIKELFGKSYDYIYIDEVVETIKCECGAEVTYGLRTKFHSDWCPKYIRG